MFILVGGRLIASSAWAAKTMTVHIHNAAATMPTRNPRTGVHGAVNLNDDAAVHKTNIGAGPLHVTQITTGGFEFVPKGSKFLSCT